MKTFKTKQNVIDAGYRSVSITCDKDVSGGNLFGYCFENEDGERTVDVPLTEGKK